MAHLVTIAQTHLINSNGLVETPKTLNLLSLLYISTSLHNFINLFVVPLDSKSVSLGFANLIYASPNTWNSFGSDTLLANHLVPIAHLGFQLELIVSILPLKVTKVAAKITNLKKPYQYMTQKW